LGLFEQWRPWALRLARNYALRNRIAGLDAAMLENEAEQALWEVLPRWKPERSPLRVFACMRILGALKDLGRAQDHCTRLQRTRLKDKAPRTMHLGALTFGEDRESQTDWEDRRASRDLELVLARDQVRELQRRLKPSLWELLREHYMEGITLAEMARRRGLTESRLSQLVHGAVASARKVHGSPHALAAKYLCPPATAAAPPAS